MRSRVVLGTTLGLVLWMAGSWIAAATTIEEVARFLERYVAQQSRDGWFVVHDEKADRDLKLKLDRVHRERLARTDVDTYFVCADFRAEDGKLYDLDFWVKDAGGELSVTETMVHKEEGKPRYTWYKDGDVWKRRPVEE